MATVTIAAMSSFDLEGGEDWIEYQERFEMYLEANGVENADKMRAVFLATLGAPGYKLLRSLAGNDTKTKTFTALCKLMKDHLQPVPNEIAQRFQFYKRDRKSGESVSAFLAELRKLSEHCNFGTTLNTYLRDRLVCGLNSQRLQQQLLREKDLTLDKAVAIAVNFEASAKDARSLHMSSGGEQEGVFRVGGEPNPAGRRECYCCGSPLHLANACRLKNLKCYGCSKVGHLKKKCRAMPRNETKVDVKTVAGINDLAFARMCGSHFVYSPTNQNCV